MRYIYISFLLFVFSFSANASVTKITNGQIFVGGTSINTDDYQSYLVFNMKGVRRNPSITYDFFGEQTLSVYQDHPTRPNGEYIFSVKMPYSPDAILINGQLNQPVWYSDCAWDIKSSIVTPKVTKDSPKFLNIKGDFSMKGRMTIYGSASVVTKIKGNGVTDLKFQKVKGRYFLFEARYTFGQK